MSGHDSHEATWTRDELAFIDTNIGMSLDELAAVLGRDRRVVSEARRRIASATLTDPWTVEDEALVLATPNLTAAQVARQLGRTTMSVRMRRHLLVQTRGVSFGGLGANKDPLHIGARPLIAKTCTKCGLLLPSEWFAWSPTNRGVGGWRSWCRKCRATNMDAWRARNPAGTRDKAQAAATQKRSWRSLQAMTAPTAKRSGQLWIDADYEVLKDPDLTLVEKAVHLKRTYNAVRKRCSAQGYRSHVGLGDAERDLWVIDNPNADLVAAS